MLPCRSRRWQTPSTARQAQHKHARKQALPTWRERRATSVSVSVRPNSASLRCWKKPWMRGSTQRSWPSASRSGLCGVVHKVALSQRCC